MDEGFVVINHTQKGMDLPNILGRCNIDYCRNLFVLRLDPIMSKYKTKEVSFLLEKVTFPSVYL